MVIKYLWIFSLGVCFTGCSNLVSGVLYTNITLPHSKDFNDTSVGTKRGIIDAHRIREPFSGQGIFVEWSDERIRAAAAESGITHITHTDRQTLSILFGIYKRQRLIIHGNRE